MNILLQILDDGRITDSQGRTVNFENTVIVMTTNAGSANSINTVGFGGSSDDKDRQRAMKALGDFLRPEFLNRVDEIVYFHKLTEENFRVIADLMLGELRDVMAEHDMSLHWDDSVRDYLVKKSFSEEYGARNLRRIIQKDIEDAIATEVIDRRSEQLSDIRLHSDGEKILVTA